MMASTTIPPPKTHHHQQPPNPQPLPLRDLLENYTTSHPLRSPSPLPPSSRQDPKLTQRTAPITGSSPLLWTLSTWITFARFVVTKGIHIIWSLISHFLFGPKRKSWGYRMTFMTSAMRNAADHTSLADIVMVRRLISLHQIIPLPADAVITPITFTVPLQAGEKIARGFLRELDMKESGSRELTGEWVVGTEVWKRLKSERRSRREQHMQRKRAKTSPLAPVVAEHDSSDTESASSKKLSVGERVIYYIHGGAYYVGNAATHRFVTIGVSKACNARVFAITYRLAPEHVFPLPLHDVYHGYLRLLAPPLSIPPENIVIMGDSAGGGLSLALCMYLRDEGYKMPAGLVLMSPWVDLTMSCGSWDENAETDVVPRPEADDHLNPVGCYLGPEGIAKYLTHPYASPLFGNLHDLPPMLIQQGEAEVLRDEVTLLAHKATLSGAKVTHELYEDMVHVFQMYPFLPAATAAINSIGRWVRVTLPKIEDELSSSLSTDTPHQSGSQGISRKVDERMEGELETAPSVVNSTGDEVVSSPLRVQPTLSESLAAQDARDRYQARSNGLRLNITPGERPSIDIDSLPATRSGSPTPTRNRSRADVPMLGETSPSDTFDNAITIALQQRQQNQQQPQQRQHHQSREHAPQLHRALSGIEHTSTTPFHSPPRQPLRRRKTTISGAPSTHNSPGSSLPATSNPVSPTLSSRRRLRSPTLGAHPTTRHRSESHSDIHYLVEGYVEGGAANETTVYAPGGEIRSVGVLGEDMEDD